MPHQTQTDRSKFLSFLLRHRPEKANLSLDTEGWCDISQLIQNTDFTLKELEQIVAEDSKGRYTIQYLEKDGDSLHEPMRIRANQGHSTASVRMTFKVDTPPPILYHGADAMVYDQIMKDGLKPMRRHHVHLSCDLSTAQAVGGRRKSHVVLRVDAARMVADGYKFFISDNGVWLVNAVPPKYITKESS